MRLKLILLFIVFSFVPLAAFAQDKPVAIPDNNAGGLARIFLVSDTRSITDVRVYIHVNHTARGNLEIELTHPDSTSVILEANDTSTRDDIIAVYPDADVQIHISPLHTYK